MKSSFLLLALFLSSFPFFISRCEQIKDGRVQRGEKRGGLDGGVCLGVVFLLGSGFKREYEGQTRLKTKPKQSIWEPGKMKSLEAEIRMR